VVKLKSFLRVCLVLLPALSLIFSLPIEVSAKHHQQDSAEVDIAYLAAHMEDFYGMIVRTNGTVKYYVSIYMYEDFWLAEYGAAIPVVVRFSGLPKPPENSSIEVTGIIDFCDLEGGFFYLNAQEVELIPEFTLTLILPLFMMATLLAIIVYRRKHMK
jgi:hypothetical protein